MARRALGHFSEAVEDLEKALEIDPANKEVREQLERARSELEEERKARKVAKAARGGPADGGDDGGHSDAGGAAGRGGCDEGPEEGRELRALRQVKGAAKAVWAAMAGPGPGGSESKGARFDPLGRRRGRREENTLGGELKALAEVVGRGESCRVHLRECGGLEALSEALKRISSGDVLAGLVPEDILVSMVKDGAHGVAQEG